MKKQILLVLIVLASFIHSYSQNKNLEEAEKINRGNQIIMNARKAIKVEKSAINSFHFKFKTAMITKIKTPSGASPGDTTVEINSVIPDKTQYIWAIEKPFPSKLTSIWNGIKYRKFSEMEILGERTVMETTNSDLKNKENLKALEGRINKEKLESLRRAGQIDPRENVNNSLWENFFPLVLFHPFEQNLEFRYAGKAQSADRTANVIDVKSQNGRNYRLLFDSETNFLLLMILNYKSPEGEYEGKYYFSNRELAGDVTIPKLIKVESKSTRTGAAPVISYRNVDIEEFSLNPEFKKNMFDVN